MKKFALVLFCLVSVISCGRRGQKESVPEAETAHLKQVVVPSIYTDPEQRLDYILNHYWDGFENVPMDELEQGFANYTAILDRAELKRAQMAMSRFFCKIEQAELADTTRHTYVLMTQMVSRYLYDPNSPLRNEDYYLPFVKAMAESPLTSEDMRQAYRFEAMGCAICQGGTVAPDFEIKTLKGSRRTLHSVNADYTVLFFSNPGCGACREIVETITTETSFGENLAAGKISIMNVYIDNEIDKWREYAVNYPEEWICGYEWKKRIREERIYDVRAIPSLYLLDKDKRIIMKDATVEKVMAFLANI